MQVVTPSTELSTELFLDRSHGSCQLRRHGSSRKLPGQPRIQLDSAHCIPYLRTAHLTADLDTLVPYIKFLCLATPTHTHISPLHHQAARLRTVVVVESPRLHLVWYHNHIFIKPIPEYMFSSSFWQFLQETDSELWKACAGFMRSYHCLIRYQIDFEKATSSELALIPAKVGNKSITFDEFVDFIEPFALLNDDHVNARFTFGELRLTRLNNLTRIFLWKATYHHIHAQWGTFLATVLAPFITLFVILSIVLNAMQVGLASNYVDRWPTFSGLSWWFAIITLIMVLVALVFCTGLVTFMIVTDFGFAKRVEHWKKKPGSQHKVAGYKSGIV